MTGAPVPTDGAVTATELRERSVLKVSLLAHPNILVRLTQAHPSGRRRVDRVAHRLDDPAGFTAALGR